MTINNIVSQLPRKGTQDSAHSIGSVTHIIVHHDAQSRPVAYDSVTRYVQQANYHIGRGEDGLQYHYKIDNVGEVFQCRNLTDTLWHCGNYPINRASIAICIDGDFTYQNPTKEQYTALKELLRILTTEHPEFPAEASGVFGHREVGSSACPGNNFYSWVTGYRTSGGTIAVPNVPFNDGSTGEVTPPPVPQTPPVPAGTMYRVYNENGVQVGAYTVLANAKTKLETCVAGVIKDINGVIVAEKKIVPVSDVPPFKEEPVEIPPVEVPPVVTPPVIIPPKPEGGDNGQTQTLLEALVDLIKKLWEGISKLWKK